MTGIKLRNSLILTVLAIVGISIIIIFNTSQQEMNQQEMNQQESNENTLPGFLESETLIDALICTFEF